MSLAMLGLSGSEQEYQLSVSRGKKGAPQPLIGHEHPFHIAMDFPQAATPLPPGPGQAGAPSFPERPPADARFALKPRRPARRGSDQEAGPSRRSVGSWAFCWGSRPSPDEPCEAPPARAPKLGQLFGVPLMQLCRDGSLPGTLLVGVFGWCEPFGGELWGPSALIPICLRMERSPDSP
nr:rho GTPase-activating protein 20-like [Microcebus murinus]